MRMRFILPALVLALATASPPPIAKAQPTVAQLSAKLDQALERIAFLDSVVGTKEFQSAQIPCGAEMEARRPKTNFPNGEYSLAYRNRQFGCAFDPVAKTTYNNDVALNRQGADIVAIKLLLAGTPSTPAPVTSGPTIAPLSSTDVQGVVAALTAGVNAGAVTTATRDTVANQLARGQYTYFNQPLIDAIKYWFYNGANAGDKAPLYNYLQIIDQRDPATNQPLQPGDPRVKQVSGSPAPATSVGTSFAGGTGVDITAAGEITLHANLGKQPQQAGLTDTFCSIISQNGYDAGHRVLQNWNHCGSKYLPASTWGADSHSAFSYNWFPAEQCWGDECYDPFPDNAPFREVNSNNGSPLYSVYRGQTLVIDGGSQQAYDYSTGAPLYRGRALLFASQRAAWPIYFAVSPTRPNGLASNRAVMKLNSDGSADPVEVVIGGTLRRLKACNVGGQAVVCF